MLFYFRFISAVFHDWGTLREKNVINISVKSEPTYSEQHAMFGTLLANFFLNKQMS